jgi:hypothetical protein
MEIGRRIGNVRFGSAAASRHRISLAAAMEREPAARCSIFDSKILNVCFHLRIQLVDATSKL